MQKAVGFYWTLPVRWAGFTTISSNVDEAATQSDTIRFQVELVRRYAHQRRFDLFHEEVFIEIDPDRGSDTILQPLKKLEKLCQTEHAALITVDFSVVHRWRDHSFLNEWSRITGISVERVPAETIRSAAWTFDPHAHFADWRERQDQWTMEKPLRRRKARDRATQLRDQGFGARSIAEAMNNEGLLSLNGKPWSESNVRALLK